MDWFLYDNGPRHELTFIRKFQVACDQETLFDFSSSPADI